MNADLLPICFINIDAGDSTLGLLEQELKDVSAFTFPIKSAAPCMHVKAYTQTQAKKNKISKKQTHLSLKYCTNSIITMLITVSVFLPVNQMNYNCFMNILRVKRAHFKLRWSLPLFQGQVTWTSPPSPYHHLLPVPSPHPTCKHVSCWTINGIINEYWQILIQ